jgi:hypothetical protein
MVWIRGCIKSFRTGRLERGLQLVQLSATRCSCIAILWVSLVSSVAITLCVVSRWGFVFYFVVDSVRKFWIHPHIITVKIKWLWNARNRDSSVSIETTLHSRRPVFTSRKKQWWDFFSSPPHPDLLWGPPSLLSNGYVCKLDGVWCSSLIST